MKRSRESEQESATLAEASSPLGSYPRAKLTGLDPSASSDNEEEVVMRCHFPPHKEALAFRAYDAYETHYIKAHTHRCMECTRNFPSNHFLMLHIEECHDPFVAVKREKGCHTFSCFVEGCERKCMTPQKRRLHLIDKHVFPKNYFFAVTKVGIDGRRSLLIDGHARRRSSTASAARGVRARRWTSNEGTAEGVEPEPQSIAAKHETAKEGAVGAVQADELGIQPKVKMAADKEVPENGGKPEPQSIATGDEMVKEGVALDDAMQADQLGIAPEVKIPADGGVPGHEGKPDTEMEDLAGAMSSLRFVPATIRFGRGKGRTGFSRS